MTTNVGDTEVMETRERYYEYVKFKRTAFPSPDIFRRYPHAVRLPIMISPTSADPRKAWLYETQPGSRWYVLNVEVTNIGPDDVQVWGTAREFREYRFANAQDQLLFQLRWANTEQ
jgi:hypothetical protein